MNFKKNWDQKNTLDFDKFERYDDKTLLFLKDQNMMRQLTVVGHTVAPALQPVMIDKL